MLAIVNINGNQFKVAKDSTLYVPFIDEKEGTDLEFKNVLFFEDNGAVLIGKEIQSKIVKAQVLKQIKGEKVIAFKMKRRKGFRKKKGHRTLLTQLVIKEII